MTKLFRFQKEDVDTLERLKYRALLANEMGTGKSIVSLFALRRSGARPCVIVCPAGLKYHWEAEAALHCNLRAEVLSGMKPPKVRLSRPHPLVIINYDILGPWMRFLKKLDPIMVIGDECFPETTPVATDRGDICIRNIVENRLPIRVASFNFSTGQIEFKPIIRYIKKERTKRMVTIRHATGEITCTENHKIWTRNRGYAEASTLTDYDFVQILRREFSSQLARKKKNTLLKKVRVIVGRKSNRARPKKKTNTQRLRMVRKIILDGSGSNTPILQMSMRREMANQSTENQGQNIYPGTNSQISSRGIKTLSKPGRETTRGGIRTPHEETQPRLYAGCYREIKRYKRKKRHATYLAGGTRGQRKIYARTNQTQKCARGRLAIGVANKNPPRIAVSNLLQSRYRKPKTQNCNRNRRTRTQFAKSQNQRQEKRCPTYWSRVVSTQIHEPANKPGLGWDCGNDPFVYCLEVADNHNFYADGALVSNCHFVKNRGTRRTRNFQELCRGVEHVIAISGTPLTNRPAELWVILNILWPDKFPSWTKFGWRYCKPSYEFGQIKFKGATRLPELHKKMVAAGMIRRLKKDVLKDLPPKIRTVISLPISDPREYTRAENEFVAWLRDTFGGRRAAAAAHAKRLVQFGYLKRLAAKLKMAAVFDWLDSFLEESDEKIIVFGIHRSIIGACAERYAGQCVLVHGGILGRARQRAYAQFQKSKRTRMFFGNDAAGVGWNGSCATVTAHIELPWTPGQVNQAGDRMHRIGQTKQTHEYFLVARKTVESRLCEILQTKAGILGETLDGDAAAGGLNIFDQLTKLLIRGDR